jgi:hypothetical protein
VRYAPYIALIALSFAGCAKDKSAPEPTRSRSEQITGKLDMEREQKREFYADKASPYGQSNSFHIDSSKQNSKSFYVYQNFQSKGYDTKSFATKNAWGGDFKYSTSEARTKTYDQVGKAVPVKSAPVKEANDAGKTAATREFSSAHQESAFKGRNQALFDKEGPAAQAKVGASWSGNLKELSVDDVREILNKNK